VRLRRRAIFQPEQGNHLDDSSFVGETARGHCLTAKLSISVVIPCYNAAPWISSAIASVAAQRVRPREVILVDDGSTDGSGEIVRRSRCDVRRLHTPRLGAAGALNAGLEAASGDWIAFLDADDFWHPNHLERASLLLEGTSDSGMLNHSHYATLNGGLRPRPYRWPVAKPTTGLSAEQFLIAYEAVRCFVGMSACIVRREAALEAGGFDESQAARLDIEFWLRLIARSTWSFDPVPSSAYRHRVPGSLSSDYVRAQYFHLLGFIKNEPSYPYPTMRRLLARSARRAMAAALTEGTATDVMMAERLAEGWLFRKDRLLFSMAKRAPRLFSSLNRRRRRLIGACAHLAGAPASPPTPSHSAIDARGYTYLR
jgi:glycosyltransferase involved in cell wall biosynthesis